MISRQIGRQDFLGGPFAPPRLVTVKRLEQDTHGARDNPHALNLRRLKQIGPGPGQPAKVRDGDGELARGGRNVAKMLREYARDLGGIEISAGGGRFGTVH